VGSTADRTTVVRGEKAQARHILRLGETRSLSCSTPTCLCSIILLFSGLDHAAQPAWPYNGLSNLKPADIIPFARLLMAQVADWEAVASKLRRKPISGEMVCGPSGRRLNSPECQHQTPALALQLQTWLWGRPQFQ
jgi:hypothetical protein